MKDYINVLKKGLSNIPNITEGWTNSFLKDYNLLPEHLKVIAEQRLSKCIECPFNSDNAKKELEYNTTLDYFHCSSCKCPINKKVYAFGESCGLEWFMFHANDDDQKHILEYYKNHNEPIELKWKKV